VKRTIFSTAILAIFLGSCSKPTEGQINAALDATVGYFSEEAAIGGEVDPTGFVLTDPNWHFGKPTYSYYRIYVTGNIDSSFLNRRISITGTVNKLTIKGVERGTRYFASVTAERMLILN